MYSVVGGKLVVWDFDGANRRNIADVMDGSSMVISSNNRWMYYLNVDEAQEKVVLRRERL
jgi:hypothetical protein